MPFRSRIGALLVVLAWTIGAASISSPPAVSAGSDAAFPRPVRHVDGGGPSIRGQLAGIVAAARSGGLRLGRAGERIERIERAVPGFAGLLTAPTSAGESVAVSLRIEGTAGEATLAALVRLGGRIANRDGSTVEAYLAPAALAELPSSDGIVDVAPILRPVPLGSIRQVRLPMTGIGVLGEGVAVHGADQWQAAGVTGTGVKVGIIDGGFVGLTARIGRELPTSVRARCYREVGLFSSTLKSCESFTEHGTAVAETVADMAPGASLYVADPLSEQDLIETVAWMTSNGVRVINVSLGYAFEGPGDGTGPPGSVYSAVNAAVKGGALWVNAAGNAGEDGWVGPWLDEDGNDLLEFAQGDEGNGIRLVGGDTIIGTLRWNDPWGRAADDYDLYLYGPSGTSPVASSEDPQTGRGDPVESFSFTASASGMYRFVVRRDSGAAVSRLQLLALTSADTVLEHRTVEDTLPSPADSRSPGSLAVGAVALDSPSTVEPYSSQGPTVDGRIKPDLVAVDCTTTVTIKTFCGTSVSTPYVAGAAALALSARPTLTPAGLASWLRARAVPLGSPTPNTSSGWGRLSLGPAPAPPAPTSLAFTSRPALAVAGVPFSPAVAVQVRDQDGQPLTSGPGSTIAVTLALADAGPPALSCTSGLTLAAVAGVATFSGCAISDPDSGVRLVASASGLTAATSPPFDVVAAGAAPAPLLTLTMPATAIAWGSGAVLSAALAARPGVPLAGSLQGRTVRLESSTDRSMWRSIGTASTDAAGGVSLTYRPATNLYYRAVLAALPDLGTATSQRIRVTVRQLALLRPTARGPAGTVARAATTTFTVLVRPARTDVPPGTVVFEVYRLVGSTRRLVSSSRVAPDPSGLASLPVTFSSSGTWSVRAMASPTRFNANSVWSPFETFVVH